MNSKISFTHGDATYTIELNESLETITEVIDKLIVPVLFGATFSNELISKYIDSSILS